MRHWLVCLTLIFGLPVAAIGLQINSIAVEGEKQADVRFHFNSKQVKLPSLKIEDHRVWLTFSGVDLNEKLKGKVELQSPHALVGRITATDSGKGNVVVEVLLNGNIEALRDRIRFYRSESEVKLSVKYPSGFSPSLQLFEKEQQPISTGLFKKKAEPSNNYLFQVASVFFLALVGVVGLVWGIRFFQKKGGFKGSRKYLVEQLSYCPLGPKSGVALLKVGSEFMLIGVTPNQINFLSSLKKLEDKYLSEDSVERSHFEKAVKEELDNIKTEKPLFNV